MFTPKTEKEKGFSLIELILVLAVLLIITGIAVDIIISVIQRQRVVLAQQEFLNQASYVIGNISTELKLAKEDSTGSCLGAAGNIYVLTPYCNNGALEACNGIKFINGLTNECNEFYVDYTDINNPLLKKITNGGAAQNMLSSKFKIIHGKFILNGDKTIHTVAATGSSTMPKVTILFNIQNNQTPSEPQTKIIQTTVSKRAGIAEEVLTTCDSGTMTCVPGGDGDPCEVDLDCFVDSPGYTCDASRSCVPGGGGIPCSTDIDCGFTCNPLTNVCEQGGGGTVCSGDLNCVEAGAPGAPQ